jgi:hypothetical protein
VITLKRVVELEVAWQPEIRALIGGCCMGSRLAGRPNVTQ